MSVLGVWPDEYTFGLLAYLYALKGLKEKIAELEGLIRGFGFPDKGVFFSNLISGFMKCGNLASVSATILQGVREMDGQRLSFRERTYNDVVSGFLQNGSIKDLATLIGETQTLESPSVIVERSVGYGIINSCVNLGLLDRAHMIFDKMNAQGASLGLGVYLPILKAYCKEQKTAEGAQLVTDISSLGLQLDVAAYDALIEASMSCQDFQSAFSMFRDMREARIPDLQGSYLTIMTGLTESHRPELMAAYLDEIVEDPRVEIEHMIGTPSSMPSARASLMQLMQVVEKSQEMKIFVDKWRYKQAFMEKHKKLRISKLRRKNRGLSMLTQQVANCFSGNSPGKDYELQPLAGDTDQRCIMFAKPYGLCDLNYALCKTP
ncbi:hypothetical protein K7X08_008349 [Anisodus acutangulus]|uniref:Pentatricopeptide repeat-containing protein n=1 Tax=Anisodus acutangulus TaxID=402998 RepID=A0A9Q1MQY3_9SOLA|nr:hypothetical protein K7X08_008349 [Anisodus acutangulus]